MTKSHDSILNLTQHAASEEQKEAGVVEPTDKEFVRELLTFDSLPSWQAVFSRAKKLAQIAKKEGCREVMIGGAPFFMSDLEDAIFRAGMQPVHAFTLRESVEAGGKKISIFRHKGFFVPIQN